MKLIKNLTVFMAAALLALVANAQPAGANSAAPTPKPAASAPAADSDPTDTKPDSAKAEVDCNDPKGSKQSVAKATGKGAWAKAGCGEAPKPVYKPVAKPAAPAASATASANAEVIARMAAELAELRAQVAKASATPACATNSWHIFENANGTITRVCKGTNDEVWRAQATTTAAATAVATAPVIANPAIVHGGSTATAGSSASAQASANAGVTVMTPIGRVWGWVNPAASARSPMPCYHSVGNIAPPAQCTRIIPLPPLAGEGQDEWRTRAAREAGVTGKNRDAQVSYNATN